MNTSLQKKLLRGRPTTVLIFGIMMIIIFWLFDALVDYHFFAKGNLLEQLLQEQGEELWFRLTVTLFLAGYTLYAWQVVRHRDRLEQQLEVALGQALDEQAKSQAIIEAIADGVSIQDLDFRVIHQNAVHLKLAGGDKRGELCYRAYASQDDLCLACPVAAALADGQVHRVEKPGSAASGAEFIEITASPVRNARGEIVGGLEIVRDITERKWTEEAIRQQTLFFQRLIDTIPSPVFYKNRQGIFLGCNEAFANCLGRPTQEIIGRSLFELMPYELAAEYADKDEELFEQTGTQIYEAFVQCAVSGSRREAIFYKATFSDPHGDVAGLVGVVIDIAERTKAERAIRELNADLSRQAVELAAVNRELEAYNYSFTHDLRNHLTRISSTSQILTEMYAERIDLNGQVLLQGIVTAADQIQELSEAMQLLFSVTRREIMHETVNISDLATAVATDLRLTDPGREAVITVQQDIYVVGDSRLMKVLLENLIGNAWKYTGKRTESIISVGAMHQGGELTCFVRDNGAGFAPDQAARLFLPFVRLHGVEEFPGTGIGLATVQRIIQRHGGRVWAEGERGVGATFWFTLPPGSGNLAAEQ
jgi:PAS domain S-box-containing protein